MNDGIQVSGHFLFYLRYPYLGLAVVLLSMAFLFGILLPTQRRIMILSGLLSLPYGGASVVFVPEYWKPVRLTIGSIGFEDFLFSLANGALVWALTAGRPKTSWEKKVSLYRSSARYLICTGFGIALSLIVWYSGFPVMVAAMGSMAGLGIFLLWNNPALWGVALSGALGFGFFYSLVLKGVFLLNPNFVHQWNHANLSGLLVGGIPLEEIGWSLGFGGVWPLFMMYVLDCLPCKRNEA